MSENFQSSKRSDRQNRLHGVRVMCIVPLAACLGVFALSAAEVDLREVITVPTEEIQEIHDGMGVQVSDFQHVTPTIEDQHESLDEEYELSDEVSILDNDERLRARLDNAIDSRSEKELIKFLDMEIGGTYKRKVLLALGDIYEQQGSPSRLIALYEKFVIEFPKDKEIPKMFLKLGCLYRDTGATKTALTKFYNVLNVALNVPVQELKDYQEISHRAQLEIAETYFSIGSYDQAAKFFKRLLKINLVEEDRLNVFFKYAYTVYLSEDYKESASILRSFVKEYPNTELSPEARYLLSETYLHLNDPKAAMQATLELLSSESSKMNQDPASWLYWQKRTGNKLANQFYQEGNYVDSLTLYRAMSGLSNDPQWLWPVLYQVGLCYEKLDMKPKAMEAYRGILQEEHPEISSASKEDMTLVSIREMSQWRIDRLELEMDVDSNLKEILQNG